MRTVARQQLLLAGKLVRESEDVVLAATQKLQRTKMKADHKAPFLPTVAAFCLSQRSMAVSGKEDDACSWALLSLWQAAVILDGP